MDQKENTAEIEQRLQNLSVNPASEPHREGPRKEIVLGRTGPVNIYVDVQERSTVIVAYKEPVTDRSRWDSSFKESLSLWMNWNGKNRKIANWSATSAYDLGLRSKHFHLKVNLPTEEFKGLASVPPGKDDWTPTEGLRNGSIDLTLHDDMGGNCSLYRTTDHVGSTLFLMGPEKPQDAITLSQEYHKRVAQLIDVASLWACQMSLKARWITAYSPDVLHASPIGRYWITIDLDDEEYASICGITIDLLKNRYPKKKSKAEGKNGRKYRITLNKKSSESFNGTGFDVASGSS